MTLADTPAPDDLADELPASDAAARDAATADDALPGGDDLRRDDGMFHSGQYRIELVQLLNWGSYAGLHRMPVGRGGIAILGPTGRGKSTVLDAMIVGHHAEPAGVQPGGPRRLPPALRAHRLQLRPRQDRRGARRRLRPDDDAVPPPARRVASRAAPPSPGAPSSARPSPPSASPGSAPRRRARTRSPSRPSTCSSAAASTSAASPRRRRDPTSTSPLTKSSLAGSLDPAHDLVTYSQPELRVRLCGVLGIGGSDESQLKALTLLRRAQASKGVFSIDELFKQFVLTQPKALSRWETTLGTYREASQLYDVFETTRTELEVLEPVPGPRRAVAGRRRRRDGEAPPARRAATSPAPSRAACASGSPARSATGWAARSTASSSRSARRPRRGGARPTTRRSRSAPVSRPSRRSPTSAATPPTRCASRCAGPRTPLARVEAQHRRFAAPLEGVGEAVPTSADELEALRGRAASLAAEEKSARREHDELRGELAARIAETRRAVGERQRQKESFERRRSNVPDEAVERRRRIADGTGVPVSPPALRGRADGGRPRAPRLEHRGRAGPRRAGHAPPRRLGRLRGRPPLRRRRGHARPRDPRARDPGPHATSDADRPHGPVDARARRGEPVPRLAARRARRRAQRALRRGRRRPRLAAARRRARRRHPCGPPHRSRSAASRRTTAGSARGSASTTPPASPSWATRSTS